MKRLTKLSPKGDRYVSAIGTEKGYWSRIIDRLAAYENTGNEPEYIPELVANATALLEELKGFKDLAQAYDEGRVVVLPCKLGDTVYGVGTPCGDCVCFNEPMTEVRLQTCTNCARKEVITCELEYDLIPELGKTVFLTREEAENSMRKDG